MAIWPFARKPKKSTSLSDDSAMPQLQNLLPARSRTEPSQPSSVRNDPMPESTPSKKDSKKRPRSASRKLSKSAAPSTRGSEKTDSIPPIPTLPEQRRHELSEQRGLNKLNQQPPADRGDIPSYYFQNPMSATSLQPEKFSVIKGPPTLHHKRTSNDQGLLRRKSSKRKKEDQAREREIKAMSSPIPIPKRPKSYQNDILARDSKRMPGDLNRNFERPMSNISLPLAESLTSQMSSSFDQKAFKVNTFGALAPRPTIRYSETPQSPPVSIGPSRSSTRKEKQPAILESDEPLEKSRKRIDDLADDMNAESLRELMEREKRRLEKRRKSENERLQRRLQRKAEHQRQEEEASATGKGKEAQDKPTVTLVDEQPLPNSDKLGLPARESGTRTPESWLKDPSREHLALDDPFLDPVVGASRTHLEEATPTDEREDPVLETAKAVRLSSAGATPPLSPSRHPPELRHTHEPSSLSQFSELAPTSTPDIPEDRETHQDIQRKDSSSGARLSSSWKSIFRRSDTRAKRGSADRGRPPPGRGTPSEFSNASRESITRSIPPGILPPRIPRVRSGTPIRTHSIFREDLPEFASASGDTGSQANEVPGQTVLPNIPGSRGTDIVHGDEKPLSEIHPAYREEVALSRNTSLRARSPEEPQSATMSESLASVDAEGSWLTGRPVKRVSTPQPLRDSQVVEDYIDSDEDNRPGTPDAEKYMGSLTPIATKKPSYEGAPAVSTRRRPELSTEGGIGSDSDYRPALPSTESATFAGEEGTTWHSAPGKHPMIVRPSGPGPRVKSREGLLNDFQAGEPGAGGATAEEGSSQSPSEHSPSSPEGPLIERATSVDLGKSHARHISAGSAKLLNLPPRNSMEIKRLSSASMGSAGGPQSPLAQSPRVPEEIETKSDDVD